MRGSGARVNLALGDSVWGWGIFRVTVPLLLLGGSPLPVGRVDSTSRLRFTATLKML